MKKSMLSILLLSLISTGLCAQGSITVTVTNVKNDKGDVYFMLHREADDTFPDGIGEAFKQVKQKAQAGQMTVTFENIPLGEYTVSIAQDRDANGEINKNFIGMPKEPIGASFMESFGKPSWRRSKFSLTADKPERDLQIKFIKN